MSSMMTSNVAHDPVETSPDSTASTAYPRRGGHRSARSARPLRRQIENRLSHHTNQIGAGGWGQSWGWDRQGPGLGAESGGSGNLGRGGGMRGRRGLRASPTADSASNPPVSKPSPMPQPPAPGQPHASAPSPQPPICCVSTATRSRTAIPGGHCLRLRSIRRVPRRCGGRSPGRDRSRGLSSSNTA